MNEIPEKPVIAPAPQRRFPLAKVVKLAAWVLVALAVVVVGRFKFFAPVRVGVVQPHRGVLVEEVFGTGTLESKVVIGVGSKIIGKVVLVLVDQGDSVTNGQTLARLEATDFEDAVRVAQAKLGQAQAELAKAKLDLERSRSLVGNKTISAAEFDAVASDFDVADARRKNAEAELGLARARLADTQIVSPIAGLVITRNLEVGSTVVPGTPIFRVADTHLLWVQAMVDEREAGKLRVDQPVRITFRSGHGRSFPGRLARLAREADRVTEEREADVAVDQLPSDWFFGAKADVYIETARKADALQIPANALVRRGDKSGVFIINGGRAQWRSVQLGLSGRDAVELAGGVGANDLVVTEPFAGKKPITDGQRVIAAATEERP